ncbi:ThuA domain-containing protein [Polaribacter sp.]|uniref:ThuA domain-containing protein n=1 Tax=Polaribacter sp. TaxID=1920175 RepID=UPI003EFA6911
MTDYKKVFLFLAFIISASILQGQVNKFYDYKDRSPEGKIHILYTAGGSYHDHLSVAAILRRFLEVRHNYYVTYTEDYSVFTRSLDKYDVIIFNGMPKKLEQEELDGFLKAVSEGKPVLGLHSAIAAFAKEKVQRQEYDKVLGAHFAGHPPIHRFPVQIKKEDHSITQNIGSFEIYDEMYFLGNVQEGSTVLLEAEHSERGKTSIAWVRKYGKGKVFYTSLGHGVGAATNKYFQQLLLNSLEWLLEEDK